MRAIRAVARRDLEALFNHPTAYVLLVAFLAVNAFLFFRQTEPAGVASLRAMLELLPWMALFLVPAVTMRSLAEEQRSGTLEIVLAQPITELELLLGKYAAQVGFLWIWLALTLPLPLALALGADLPVGVVIAQYGGAALLLAGLAGVGVWASSVTRNQMTAFILGVVVMFALVLVGLDPVLVGLPPGLGAIAASLGVLAHFASPGRGALDLRDVLYFVSLAAAFLALAYLALLGRKLAPGGAARRRLGLGTGILLAALVALNLAGRRIPWRLDLTPNRALTLSPATKRILRGLDDLVTFKLFATSALPPQVALLQRDVEDLLRDYRASGRGNVRLVITDPGSDTAAARDARALGIGPIQFNVLGRGELQVKEGWLGVAVQHAGEHRQIPLVDRTDDLEYRLTAFVRELTRATKPAVGWIEYSEEQGTSFGAVRGEAGQSYDVRSMSLADSALAPDLRALVVLGSPPLLSDTQAQRLRGFLARGGGVLVAASGMAKSGGYFASARPVLWNPVLAPYGLAIRSDMAYDLASNEAVGMPTEVGRVAIAYPFWVRALSTRSSPINAALDDVFLPWPSTIDTTGAPRGALALLFTTSRAGGVQEPTAMLAPMTQLPQDSLRTRVLAVSVNAATADSAPGLQGRLVLVGGVDFLIDRYVQNSPQNGAFFLNALDWLAQDEDLVAIRSKRRGPPPLVFASAIERAVARYGNMIGVPLLVVVAGVARLLNRRRKTRQPYVPFGAGPAAPGGTEAPA